MNRMSKIHIWVGLTDTSKTEFDKYFDQQNSFLIDPKTNETKDETELVFSNFFTDLDREEMFDEDFLSIVFNEDSNLETLLEEVQLDIDEDLLEICNEKGIKNANAMFFYTDSELEVIDKIKKYNDLTYIGVFDWF